MKISRSGFVYQVAYGKNVKKDSVNLCQLVRKFIFMLFLGWPLIGVVTVVAFLVCFFFAMRPIIFKDDGLTESGFISYLHWPKTRSGKRIWPIWFVLGAFVLWLLPKIRFNTMAVHKTVYIATNHPFLGIIGCLAALIGILLLAKRFFKSEAWLICKAYCEAKKEKICPIVKVVE